MTTLTFTYEQVKTRLFWVVFLLACTLFPVFAAQQNITFHHLTTDNGLSQFSVNCLYIDENGFVWVGTREGLNRYNGNDVRTYKLQKQDTASLFCNTVLRLDGNRNGKIYVLCTEGLAELDLVSQRFTTLWAEKLSALYYDEKLYVAKGNELYAYEEAAGRFEPVYRLPGEAEITCVSIDRSGIVWLGTENGLYKSDGRSGWTCPVPEARIISLYRDSAGDLWAGTWESGAYRIDRTGTVFNYRHRPDDPASISSDFVRAYCEDNAGNIWIGTFNGLNLYKKNEGVFYRYVSRPDEPESLSHSSVWCLVKDRQGTLWIGTYFGGVNYFNPEYEIYTRYRAGATEAEGLSSPVVGCMTEDGAGNLWICTEGGGITVYERKKKRFRWYRPGASPYPLSERNIKAVYYDAPRQTMWVGTHLGGLNELDLKTGRFRSYRMKEGDPSTLPSNIIRDIEPYADRLVIATQNGVCLFDPASGRCTPLFAGTSEGARIKMVADVLIDRNGVLWIAATGEGVFAYRFDTGELLNYRHRPGEPHSLSNNNVNSLMEDSAGNLWLSTSGSGLDRYRPETGDFENFDSYTCGLSSDCVYNVAESGTPGRLLLITNQGFSIFDSREKKFYNYAKENGFPLTAVNENALYVTRDGEVFLGGVQGMISFYEKDLDFTRKPYRITWSRLSVNGKEVRPSDRTGILDRDFAYTRAVTLRPGQSMFTAEFATSNFIAANRESVFYRLEGFSSRWNRLEGTRSITYTNLDPGNYTLVVRSGDTPPLAGECRLQITVLPPFYRTLPAYLIYIVLAGTLLWYLVGMYKARLRLSESLKYEQKRLEDIERLNQSKLRFFTNISHEFRTPLTLIVGQVEALMHLQQFTPAVYNKILGIYKNSLQLKELITELLDFRKQEQGHIKLKAGAHNLSDFVYENYLLFVEYATKKGVSLQFEKEADLPEVWYDTKQMQKVLNNLLSNALKHTPEKGAITLRVKQEENRAVVEVSDTGCGIRPEEVPYIFDRFYQTGGESTAETGTGIGLALTKGIVELHRGTIAVRSEWGEGTTFTLSLQLGNAHFTPEELCNETEAVQHIERPVAGAVSVPVREAEQTEAPNRIAGAKMLIAEDNEEIRQMLAGLFRPFYEVTTASDGEEALALVRSEMPQIVLSDVVMPSLSGTELCKRIKAEPETCHIPVVLLTARTALEYQLEGLRTGADDYITKPFHIPLLISRCNNLVNSRLILQEKFNKQPQAFPQMLATNPIDKEILDRAIRVIEKYLDDPAFNIELFAREMGMARTNLFAKIKAITGQTPNTFVLTIRLKKGACMLRSNPELNVTEISEKTGFTSARYFSKCFKDTYHVSPLAYRRGKEPGEEE